MQMTTISQLGNSNAVILPSSIMKETKWRRGQKMAIDYVPEAHGILIRPVKKTVSSQSEIESQKWFDEFIKENGEILDELATR